MTNPSIPDIHPAATRPRARFRIWLWTAATVLVLIVLAFVAWNNGLRDRFIPKNLGVVEPGKLYRSGQISAALIKPVLQKFHIKVIVDLAARGAPPADVAAETSASAALGIDHELFPLSGNGTGSLDFYADAITAVAHAEAAHKPVLVHCVAGAQRTGGVIALYELLVEHRPESQVYAQLLRYGHNPRDNPKLIPFLNQNMAAIAQKLVSRGVINKVPTPLPRIG